VYAIQHIPVPVPSQDKIGRVAAGRAFGVKMGGLMEVDG